MSQESITLLSPKLANGKRLQCTLSDYSGEMDGIADASANEEVHHCLSKPFPFFQEGPNQFAQNTVLHLVFSLYIMSNTRLHIFLPHTRPDTMTAKGNGLTERMIIVLHYCFSTIMTSNS